MSEQQRPQTRSTYVAPNEPYPLEERMRIGQLVHEGRLGAADVVKQLGCDPKTPARWAKQYATGKPMRKKGGRPPKIDPALQKVIDTEIASNTKKGLAVRKPKFKKMLQARVNQTAIQDHRPPSSIDNRFVNDYARKHNIRFVNAENTSNAHLVAQNDPRHAASYAAMMYYLHQKVPTGLFVNVDKSSFEMKASKKEKSKGAISGERPQAMKNNDPDETKSNGNCAVHLYAVANDGGKLADFVYVVKDNKMNKDEVDVYEAPMLASSTSPDAKAYLLFIGESSPNTDNALVWLFETIVIPFVHKLREKNTKYATKPASLTVDGDPRQLQVLASSIMVTAFQLANIIASKSPASCTPLFQPLDVGKLFLASKTAFEALINDPDWSANPDDIESLAELFRAHLRKYGPMLKTSKRRSEAFKSYDNNCQTCLLAAATALRATAVSSVVMNSFKLAGVSPFDSHVIREKCTYFLTPELERRFYEAVPELAAIFERNSELKESDFEDAHIPANNTSKDGVAVHKRRALLLHAPHVLKDLADQAAKRQKTSD